MVKILNIITGVSGAGKSMALRTFEDLDFEIIDNIPLKLLPEILTEESDFKIAVGIDIRSRGFSNDKFVEIIKHLKNNDDFETNVIFIDCDDNVIRKRYTETRRKHPLTKNKQILEALKEERALLSLVKEISDFIIDTSDMTGHAFKRVIENKFAFGTHNQKLSLMTMSFAYKKGIPSEADLVFDVRFLRNPHYDENLRHKTGLSQEVRDYVKVDKDYDKFWDNLKSLFDILIPRYIEEGKSYLTIAFGCTGGRHRSVTFAYETKCYLESKGYKVDEIHREIEKEIKKV